MYAGRVNFTSLLFMNVYSIYTLFFWFMQKERKILFKSLVFVPLCWWIDKKGERNLEFLYACLFYLLPFTIGIKIGIKCIFCLLVSRASIVVSFDWYKKNVYFISTKYHVYAYLCWAFTIYLYCLLLCMR